MEENLQTKKDKFSIWIFIIVTLLCGWFGIFIDTILTEQPEGQSLGMLIWLVFPMLTVVILRTKNKDWKDNGFSFHFRGNIKWYITAIFVNILVAGLCVILGLITQTITYHVPKLNILAEIIIVAILTQLLKNIFEEFAWRGFLTHKLEQNKFYDIIIYFIVGIIWFLWHLPYYLFFLDESLLGKDSRIDLIWSSFFILLLWSIMYVELYRIIHSIWPCVIMHAISNVIQYVFVYSDDGILFSSKTLELLLNPVNGILAMILFVASGFLMRVYRIKHSTVI